MTDRCMTANSTSISIRLTPHSARKSVFHRPRSSARKGRPWMAAIKRSTRAQKIPRLSSHKRTSKILAIPMTCRSKKRAPIRPSPSSHLDRTPYYIGFTRQMQERKRAGNCPARFLNAAIFRYRCSTRSRISWVRPWFQNWVPMYPQVRRATFILSWSVLPHLGHFQMSLPFSSTIWISPSQPQTWQ